MFTHNSGINLPILLLEREQLSAFPKGSAIPYVSLPAVEFTMTNRGLKCSHGVMSEDGAHANCCLTLWRAGWVRSHSDTAPGVAACPLALELRDQLLPLTPWT